MTIARGLIIKIIFVFGLVYALMSVYQANKIKNKNDYFKEMKW